MADWTTLPDLGRQPGMESGFGNQQSDSAPNWPGSPADKQRAMKLLQQKSRNAPITKESSDWLDGYMEWIDRSLPPIPRLPPR